MVADVGVDLRLDILALAAVALGDVAAHPSPRQVPEIAAVFGGVVAAQAEPDIVGNRA